MKRGIGMKRIRKFSTDFISILVIFAMLFCVFPLSANASDIKGDINHNGVLDSRDALLIQRCCIGLIKLTDEEKQQADYNSDSKISSKDVLAVLRCVIGLEKPVDKDGEDSDDEIINEVMNLVNDERKSCGLKPLTIDEELCKVAQVRSEEIVENFSHTRLDGSRWVTVLEQANIYYHSAGENIAAGFRTAEEVFESWMQSEEHRQNILSCEYCRQGVALTFAEGTEYEYYWAQIFTDDDDHHVYDTDSESDEDYAEAVTKYVNIEREKAGLQPVELDEELCKAAEIRAAEIVASFSHERPNGNSWYTVLREADIPYRFAGENIAGGFITADRVVAAWMESEGHRENILCDKYTKMGVGLCHIEGTVFIYYWDQIFTDGGTNPDDDGNNDMGENDNVFANEVVKLVNEEREKAGLPALEYDANLTRAAQRRSEELVQSFGHTRPDGQSWFTILDEENISYSSASENVAAAFKNPEKVVNAWMNSDGHRKAILSPDYKKIGVGYTFEENSESKHYWDQLFTD